jgi:hypothetical protein
MQKLLVLFQKHTERHKVPCLFPQYSLNNSKSWSITLLERRRIGISVARRREEMSMARPIQSFLTLSWLIWNCPALSAEYIYRPVQGPESLGVASPHLITNTTKTDSEGFLAVSLPRPSPPIPMTSTAQSARTLCGSSRVGPEFYCNFLQSE